MTNITLILVIIIKVNVAGIKAIKTEIIKAKLSNAKVNIKKIPGIILKINFLPDA